MSQEFTDISPQLEEPKEHGKPGTMFIKVKKEGEPLPNAGEINIGNTVWVKSKQHADDISIRVELLEPNAVCGQIIDMHEEHPVLFEGMKVKVLQKYLTQVGS